MWSVLLINVQWFTVKKVEEEVKPVSSEAEESDDSCAGAASLKPTSAVETVEGAIASGLAKGRDTVDAIRDYLAEKLGFYDDSETRVKADYRIKVTDPPPLFFKKEIYILKNEGY
jgi:hypothetical protein